MLSWPQLTLSLQQLPRNLCCCFPESSIDFPRFSSDRTHVGGLDCPSVSNIKHRCVLPREPLTGPPLLQDVGAAKSPGGPAEAVCPDAQVETGHPPRPGSRLSP